MIGRGERNKRQLGRAEKLLFEVLHRFQNLAPGTSFHLIRIELLQPSLNLSLPLIFNFGIDPGILDFYNSSYCLNESQLFCTTQPLCQSDNIS